MVRVSVKLVKQDSAKKSKVGASPKVGEGRKMVTSTPKTSKTPATRKGKEKAKVEGGNKDAKTPKAGKAKNQGTTSTPVRTLSGRLVRTPSNWIH
ncbi:unnamed protein product [Strongylus vulgaris]|uniref:Uncharacterized protein n=1 Tax=Strongylus vulgaris TaxID=40348 RepID=A0A3P7JJ80_STRVU|nr:unnamed protein product [Strongylus vulgaris]